MKKSSKENYIQNLRQNLSEDKLYGLKKETKEKILDRVQSESNDLDKAFLKGWKYLKKRYLSNIKDEWIYFYKSEMGYNCMCIQRPDLGDGFYTVTFTFLHDDDFDNVDKDYKKYCIYNFLHDKYTYNVKATSFLNAISLANNKNSDKFPKKCRYLIVPTLTWCDIGYCKYPEIKSEEDFQKQFNEYCSVDFYKKYIDIRQKLLDQGYNHSDIRYFKFDYDFGALVLRKDNKYKVIFSFVNPKDYNYIIKLQNEGDYKHIYRYNLINNYLNNKYCYDCEYARNSIFAAYYAFKDHCKDFPNRFKKAKVKIELIHYVED